MLGIPADRRSLLYLTSLPWPLAVLWHALGRWRALPSAEQELGEAQAGQAVEPPRALGWPELCALLASWLLEELERLPALLWAMCRCRSLETGMCCRPLQTPQRKAAARRGPCLQHRARCRVSLVASFRQGPAEGSPGLPA